MNGKPIAINGKNFRWRAVQTRTGYNVTVQSTFVSGQKLRIVELPLIAQSNRWGDVQGEVASEYNIAEMIQAALRRGWEPYTEGLPDFVI